MALISLETDDSDDDDDNDDGDDDDNDIHNAMIADCCLSGVTG